MLAHEREYILYCDESIARGAFYSNFYGGILVGGSVAERVSRRLEAVKLSQNLLREVKWQRVTDVYLRKYLALMDAFFDEVAAGNVKVRIMFRQNAMVPTGLTPMQLEQGFYILYYQFIKHAFGFDRRPPEPSTTRLRVYCDQFPDTGEQVARFKGYILGLNSSLAFRAASMALAPEDLTEVRSHEHVLLQCLDVVLGAMAFRLNDLHKAVPEGQRRRGKRTVAKEKLYKHILTRIRRFHPNFNIGITTGGSSGDLWTSKYRHWSFVPTEHVRDKGQIKGDA